MRNPPKPCLTQPSRITPLKPERADTATNFVVANRIGGGDFSTVPRKPTLLARKAKSALVDLIGQLPPESALPTVRELGAPEASAVDTIIALGSGSPAASVSANQP